MFHTKVKGVDICVNDQNKNHSGKEGHWLETQMGIKHNSKNEPDLYGYEQKTGEHITTAVDKAPDIKYLAGVPLKSRDKAEKQIYWRKYASKKMSDEATLGGWSISKYNLLGQKMVVDESNNIQIVYDYSHDTRENKEELDLSSSHPHIIMEWKAESLKKCINCKFNQKGWFKCVKKDNKFVKICFGVPINFDMFIAEIKKGIFYHDGYSKLNGRGRNQFRASNKFWDALITEEY